MPLLPRLWVALSHLIPPATQRDLTLKKTITRACYINLTLTRWSISLWSQSIAALCFEATLMRRAGGKKHIAMGER